MAIPFSNLRFLGVATTRDPLKLRRIAEPKVLRTAGEYQSAEVQPGRVSAGFGDR